MHTPGQRAEKTTGKSLAPFPGSCKMPPLFRSAGWQLQRVGLQQRWQQRQLVDGYGVQFYERIQPEHELQQHEREHEQQQ